METFRREIFEHLGYVYYTIAAEQGTPSIMAGELKMAIKKEWLSEGNVVGAQKVSEAAHLIGITIDALQTERVPASDAFATFERFYHKHEEQFSDALKRQILETAETVMRILPSGPRKNEYYERLKGLLFVSKDANVKL